MDHLFRYAEYTLVFLALVFLIADAALIKVFLFSHNFRELFPAKRPRRKSKAK